MRLRASHVQRASKLCTSGLQLEHRQFPARKAEARSHPPGVLPGCQQTQLNAGAIEAEAGVPEPALPCLPRTARPQC